MKIVFRIIHLLILIISLIIQIVFIENLKLYYMYFDLVLVMLVIITLYDGAITGIMYGFAIGMVLDLMVGNIVGISPLIYAVSAFIVSRLTEIGFKKKLLAYTFIIFIITDINILFMSIIRYLFNFSINMSCMGLELLLRPIYNIILMLIIYPFLRVELTKKKEFGI